MQRRRRDHPHGSTQFERPAVAARTPRVNKREKSAVIDPHNFAAYARLTECVLRVGRSRVLACRESELYTCGAARVLPPTGNDTGP
jgi:hypothetical protein